MMSSFNSLNDAVGKSFIGRFFEFEKRGTKFTTEIRGAVATFLTMSYILAVNPRILADSGGPCIPGTDEEGGLFAVAYEECMEDVKRQYVTATALASVFGCFIMGIFANLPIALSCGMGLNAYYTYTVVGWRGTGRISFNAANTAVCIEGAIFFIMAVTGARYAVVKLIPVPVKKATPAGIGFFLAHLGLQTAEGIGIVVSDIATAVTLGGCPPEKRTLMTSLSDACMENGYSCLTSDAYTCDDLGGVMTSATTWIGIAGMVVIAILLCYKQNWAFTGGVLLITIISWFRDTPLTYFPRNEVGDSRFEYFSKVVSFEPLNLITFHFSKELKDITEALLTFLYVDFLDTSGTLLAITSDMGIIDQNGDFPKSRQAFAADAFATFFGSWFSLSPVTSYIESAAGVAAGAKTGCCACIVGIFFFLSLFFAPIFSSIPPWATGGALIIIGSLMSRSLGGVQWNKPDHAVTAFITVIMMPLTYSIAYGLIAGIGIWIIFKTVFFILSKLGVPRPDFEDTAEAKAQPEMPSAKEAAEQE